MRAAVTALAEDPAVAFALAIELPGLFGEALVGRK